VLSDNWNLVLSPDALTDLNSGLLKPRLAAILEVLLAEHRISVRLFRTGHPMGEVSPDGRTNDHYFYAAADIDMVDDLPVLNNGGSPALIAVGHLLAGLPADLAPRVVMGPAEWHRALGPEPRPHFRDDRVANVIHADHLHIGVDPGVGH
jgi:hypothetical protein